MKLLTLSIFAFLLFSNMAPPEKQVYICKGKGSKRYHFKKDCRGLKNCSTPVQKVTLTKAKQLKRSLCGWED